MEKINIAELLKDCPSGMELDCTIVDGLYFDKVTENNTIKCYSKRFYESTSTCNSICFYSDGSYLNHTKAKCVIFPKGKTTWEGFQRPFKDGDIVAFDTEKGAQLFIFKEYIHNNDYAKCVKCYMMLGCGGEIDFESDGYYVERLATEEEKEKLFDAIKANGYKWNAETKTLEKLEDIEDKGNISDGYHTFNELYEYRLLYNASMFNELAKQGLYDVHKSKLHSDGTIPFGDDNWFIVQAELPTGQISNHYEMKDWDLFQVPIKEKANQYDGHTPQDVAKRLRDFLTLEKLIEPKFKVGDSIQSIRVNLGNIYNVIEVKESSYVVNKNNENSNFHIDFDIQDDWELVPNKFDVTTLKPFDSKVLVRDKNTEEWRGHFFSHYDSNSDKPYVCIGVEGLNEYKQCIPYEGNEHLFGTTNDCDEFYKTW